MSDKTTQKNLTIKGYPANKKVIKFTDAKENQIEDKWYETDAKVQALDLAKFGIIAGAKVEVSFDEAMKIVFMKAQKTTQPEAKPVEQKQEVKPEAKPVEQKQEVKPEAKEEPKQEVPEKTEVKEMVIEAVSKDKKFIKFENDTEKWRNASPEVMALDYQTLGVVKGNKALVTLEGKTILVLCVENKTEAVEDTKSTYTGSTNNIDRQSAVKSSAEIIKALIEAGKITNVEEADVALRKLSRTATELIG